MADYTTSARPYARAVYTLATEASTVDGWSEALALMAAVASDPAMRDMLDKPQLSKQQKGELMLKVLSDRLDQHQQNLVRLLAENGRLRALPEVAHQLQRFLQRLPGL